MILKNCVWLYIKKVILEYDEIGLILLWILGKKTKSNHSTPDNICLLEEFDSSEVISQVWQNNE